jgi:hypothetical protein
MIEQHEPATGWTNDRETQTRDKLNKWSSNTNPRQGEPMIVQYEPAPRQGKLMIEQHEPATGWTNDRATRARDRVN